LAASLVGLGRVDEARAAIKEVLARKPDCTVAFVSEIIKFPDGDIKNEYIGHLQLAGLPD
jgi:hypothetical protein